MRPGQGQRRGGRRNGGGHDRHRHSNGGGQSGGQQRSATSLRNQIFDSNGPDTRVRGNAFQVHEKYQALAKDALSSGDRVLAENYLQHAEHYYRIIEAINEATEVEQRARQANWDSQPPQQPYYAEGQQPEARADGQENGFAPQGEPHSEQRSEDGQPQQQQRYGQERGERNHDRRERYERHQQQRRDQFQQRRQRFDGDGQQQQYQQNPYENPAQQSQNQQQGQPAGSADPLYDGIDEEQGNAQDIAMGGRR